MASKGASLPLRELDRLHVTDTQAQETGSGGASTMERSTSAGSSSVEDRGPDALDPSASSESDRPPMLLRNSSTGASSNSSFSRKSSIRSTDSVAAVPVRSPVRTPLQTPAISRTTSGMNYPGVPPLPTTVKDRAPSSSSGSPRPIHSQFAATAAVANGAGPRSPPPKSPSLTVNPNPTPTVSSSSSAAAGPASSSSAAAARVTTPNTGVPPPPFGIPRLPSHIQSDPPTSFHIPMPAPGTASSSPGSSTFAGSLPTTPSQGPPRPPHQRPDMPARVSTSTGATVARRTANDFDFGAVLGEGSYSTVYAVTDRIDPSRQYALKVLDKRHIVKEKKQKYVTVEKDTLYRLDRHPGIVRLYWTFHDENSLYFVLELASNGELLKCIKRSGSFALGPATFYAAQVLAAVEHMHQRGVIHRDLKPENILLDDHMRVKITDFGTAKILKTGSEERANSFVGTAEYVSPELLQSKTAYKSSDLWAFGCILYQMLAGKPPFKAANEYLTFQKIINLEYSFPDQFPPEAEDLIKKLLLQEPSQRLGADERGIGAIKAHPFFASVHWESLWTVEPPEITSGLVPAPPPQDEEHLKGVMDDYFSFAPLAPTSTRSTRASLDVRPSHRRRAADSVDSSGSSVIDAISSSLPTNRSSETSEEVKWAQTLLPREQILLSGDIQSRSTIFNKRCFLMLTDYPRLLVCRVHKSRVKVKHEVLFGIDTPQPEYAPAGAAAHATGHMRSKSKGVKDDDGTSLQTFVTAVEENQKAFRVATNLRAFRFEDATGTISATRWVSTLRQTHQSSHNLNKQNLDRSPEGGVPLPLPPVSATSSGSSGRSRQPSRLRSNTAN